MVKYHLSTNSLGLSRRSPLPLAPRQEGHPSIQESDLSPPSHPHLMGRPEDCAITVGPDTTTLRAQLPDQGALFGLVERITALGLEVAPAPRGAATLKWLISQITARGTRLPPGISPELSSACSSSVDSIT